MAVNQDELLAQMLDQTLAKRGGRSAALATMRSLDPAINPPPAPRTVMPPPLTVQPVGRPGALPAGRQGGPAPLPAVATPRPAAKPVAVQPGFTHVGRAGIPARVLQAGAGRGAAAPVTAVAPPLAPAAPAATQASRAPAAPAPVKTVTPAPTTLDPSGNFRTLTRPDAASALNSDNAGSATIQGRFLNKDGTRGPQETRAYTQGGIADAGKRVNVVPGLFSGVSQETEAALSAARQGAADRGDFDAVERSYMTPEQKQAAKVQKAENKILRAVGGAPLSQLPQVAQAVSGIQAGRTEAALGGQQLAAGEQALQQGQQMQSMLGELAALVPTSLRAKRARIRLSKPSSPHRGRRQDPKRTAISSERKGR